MSPVLSILRGDKTKVFHVQSPRDVRLPSNIEVRWTESSHVFLHLELSSLLRSSNFGHRMMTGRIFDVSFIFWTDDMLFVPRKSVPSTAQFACHLKQHFV